MRRAASAVAVLWLLGLVACKSSERARVGEAISKFRAFTDQVCACRDKACTSKVMEDMATWASGMTSSANEPKPTADEATEMSQLGERFNTCMKRLGPDQPQLDKPGTPANTTPKTADEILKQSFDQVDSTATITDLRLSYVRADGTIDATYGTAEIHFGRPKRAKPADDPDRPIGAPVPVDQDVVDDLMARCPVHEWKAGVRTERQGICISFGALVRPRCSVLELWKQAIEDGAPAKGLAVLELQPAEPQGAQQWSFHIDDEPRAIHYSKSVPDVCDPTLEKPLPMPTAPSGKAVPLPF